MSKDKQEPQMMICPKAKECNKYCLHRQPHLFRQGLCNCNGTGYITSNGENRRCPHCWSYFVTGLTSKAGILPADLQLEKQVRKCKMCFKPLTEGYSDCLHCGYSNTPDLLDEVIPQPPIQQMPLIEPPAPYLLAYISSWSAFCDGRDKQRDADMAWHNKQIEGVTLESYNLGYESCLKGQQAHDQQVRKAFAEKCIKWIEETGVPSEKSYPEAVISHIRALAEKEGK